MTRLYNLCVIFLFSSCIGTDIVEEAIIPEVLTIIAKVEALKVGESYQFMADYFDANGIRTNVPIMWVSSDESIISINNQGIAMANMKGTVFIVAEYGNVKDSVLVEAGEQTITRPDVRTGEFQGRNNYVVKGDFELALNEGNLTLIFKNNFETSNGPGLHVYLSNQSNNVVGGVDLGELKSNKGNQQYDLPENINVNTYDYVIIYCKPFAVVFGNGKLN